MSTWMDAPTTSSSSSSSASPSLKGFAENATQAVAAGVNFSMVNHTASPPGYETGAKFNPSMAIIIVVLLGTFFFMAFLSIYVKKCVTTESDMEHHHVPTSWAVDHSTGMRFSTQSHHGNLLQVQQQQQQHQTGLDKASIQALPIVGFTKSKECCVCLAEFQENECVRLLPRCGHTFHVECIDLWLVSHSTCPLCRFKLTAHNVVADTAALHPLQSVPQQLQQQQQREESSLPVSIQPEVPPPQNSVQRASHPHSGQELHQPQQLQLQQAAPEDGPSPPPSIAINISDLEQGMIDQECGDEQQQQQQQQQHNAGAPSLLLKVLKVFRSWRAGLRATIAGNRIFS